MTADPKPSPASALTTRSLTIAALLTILGAAAVQRMGLPAWSAASSAKDPQEVVYAMSNAAQAGDVKSYLAAFTGPMVKTLTNSISESTESGFARYLKASNSELKGVAVTEPQPVSASQVKVRVDYVYQNRTEAQVMYLEAGPRGWKVSRVDADQRVQMLIPYGTRVKEIGRFTTPSHAP